MRQSQNHQDEESIYLKTVLASYRRAFRAALVFSFFISLLMFSIPLYLLQIYDKVIPSRSTDTLIVLTVIVLGAILTLSILEATRRRIFRKAAADFELQIGQHLLSSAISKSSSRATSSVNVLKDLTRLRNFLSSSGLISILDLPWTPVFIAFLFYLHIYIGSLALIGSLILVGLAILHVITSRKSVIESDTLNKHSSETAKTYVNNADVIQAMGMQKQVLERWQDQNTTALLQSNAVNKNRACFTSLAKIVRLLLQVSVIFLAAWLIVQGQLTAGATIAGVLLMRRAISPIEGAIKSWKTFQKSRASLRNIEKYLKSSPTLKNHKSMPIPEGDLVLEKLIYRLKGEKHALLKGINLKIQAGEAIAVVGSTAVGKSTLSRLVVGLTQPTSGRVLLGGFELKLWTSDELGPHVGYLPQDVKLFSGTIRENIARLQSNDIEKVVEAAKMANVHDVVLKMPHGYETEVGEGGSLLSGGQRQRIALARAVYGSPCLVVMDEPDANLDDDGKAALAVAINKLKSRGAVVFVVTHQKQIRKFVDKVYRISSRGLSLSPTGSAAVPLGSQSSALLYDINNRKSNN